MISIWKSWSGDFVLQVTVRCPFWEGGLRALTTFLPYPWLLPSFPFLLQNFLFSLWKYFWAQDLGCERSSPCFCHQSLPFLIHDSAGSFLARTTLLFLSVVGAFPVGHQLIAAAQSFSVAIILLVPTAVLGVLLWRSQGLTECVCICERALNTAKINGTLGPQISETFLRFFIRVWKCLQMAWKTTNFKPFFVIQFGEYDQ